MKNYSKEFKVEAVKRALEPGAKVTQVAVELGVHYSTLKGWMKNYKQNNENPFIGSGNLSPKDAEVLEVSRSGYYKWLHRPTSIREQENNQWLIKIKELFYGSKQNILSPLLFVTIREDCII